VKVTFCRICGRPGSPGFLYCPYCGIPLPAGPGLVEACSSFATLEQMQEESRVRRIEALIVQLEGLESDVEAMLGTGTRTSGREPAGASPGVVSSAKRGIQ